jgi:threonine dehydratase
MPPSDTVAAVAPEASLAEVRIEDVTAARARIASYLHRTPLARSETLSRELGTNVYLKLEVLQKTGSFKARGAFSKLTSLPAGSRVVAASGGNHGQAVSYAAGVLGMPARIVMPRTTAANYLNATRDYGAEVILTPDIGSAFALGEEAATDGWVRVHPFDDREVIAGQGTVALEILEDLPQVTDVICSIGGGGLAAGTSLVIKSAHPEARVWGAETDGADCMSRAFAAGHVVTMDKITSIAKTLGPPSVSPLTFAMARKRLEKVEVVTDAEAVRALYFLLERMKVLTEPAAACTLAAARRLKRHFTPDSHLVLVLCGGNLSMADLHSYASIVPVGKH